VQGFIPSPQTRDKFLPHSPLAKVFLRHPTLQVKGFLPLSHHTRGLLLPLSSLLVRGFQPPRSHLIRGLVLLLNHQDKGSQPHPSLLSRGFLLTPSHLVKGLEPHPSHLATKSPPPTLDPSSQLLQFRVTLQFPILRVKTFEDLLMDPSLRDLSPGKLPPQVVILRQVCLSFQDFTKLDPLLPLRVLRPEILRQVCLSFQDFTKPGPLLPLLVMPRPVHSQACLRCLGTTKPSGGHLQRAGQLVYLPCQWSPPHSLLPSPSRLKFIPLHLVEVLLNPRLLPMMQLNEKHLANPQIQNPFPQCSCLTWRPGVAPHFTRM